LRTYPRRSGGYPFAPRGERSVARGLLKAIENARDYIFIEDQYLWSKDIGRRIAAALRRNPSVQLIAVVPHHPDQDGALALPPNIVGRQVALHSLAQFRDRVAVYGIENEDGTPIYVHAKLCIVDDQWLSVGSANMNRRSWTHDSELTAAVVDPHLARDLRLRLAREHLGTDFDEPDVRTMCAAFHSSALALQDWYDGGRKGTRPAGQLRPLHNPPLPLHTRAWSTVLYRTVYDPDGRPLGLRLRNGY
jgi:phosphatidylserine/phosphatidylglycerophosphate/cardiolipin synthase-like enzyme